jgi:signal transduction histidine kinase
VSTAPTSTPTLARLNASRAQQEAVLRWLRPLAPFVMILVALAALRAHPGPGRSGRDLAVSIALGGFVLAGLGVLVTVRRQSVGRVASAVRVTVVVVLLVTSAVLMWLQPDGVSIAGIFVGLSLLAPMLRSHPSVPFTVVALVFLGVILASAGRTSVTLALLNAIMLGAFYGMLFLASRLGEANELAERLLVELEQSRAVEARAAGLAERQRLAREMHDVLAHSLSGLMLQLEGARMMAASDPTDPRLPQVVNRAHHLGRTGLDEARRAIGMLRDDELPGPERLAVLAAQFQQDRNIPCRFTVSGQACHLDSEARLALFRVAQEALTNITKHAQPERVELHLAYEPATTRLTVEDFTTASPAPPTGTGPGAEVDEVASGGYGLTGMRERAELLGGTLTTEITRSGFRVKLDVPV